MWPYGGNNIVQKAVGVGYVSICELCVFVFVRACLHHLPVCECEGMCVGFWLFLYVCVGEYVYLWAGLAGTLIHCADGEQEDEDSSLQAVVCC